jgi:hypothetical protein
VGGHGPGQDLSRRGQGGGAQRGLRQGRRHRGRLLRQQGRQPGRGKGQAAPRQPAAQQLQPARQPLGDRAARPAEFLGGLDVSTALEVTGDQRRPVPVRQAGQLLVQRRPQAVVGRLPVEGRAGHACCLPFVSPAPRRGPAHLQGDAVGDAVQPAAQGGGAAHRPGPAHQHEEGRLEGVGGVGLVGQQAAAGAQDERAVAAEQRLEGRLVAPPHEAVEELAVGLFRRRRADQFADVAQNHAQLHLSHSRALRVGRV